MRHPYQLPNCHYTLSLSSLPFLICSSSVVRDLGVWIDNGLTMSTHITKVVAGCFASLRQLRSVRRSLSHESFTWLVVALVLVRLDYCNRVLAGLPASQLSRLQSVLHTAARLIYGVRRCDHITPLLQQLHWLSVPERVTFKLCIMVYLCLHGIGPEYFSEDFQARVRDLFSPATALGLQYRRRGSCHMPVFTWQPSIPGRRSSSVEHATAQCHLCTIFVLILATPEDISFPATTASITLTTVSWS